MPCFHWPRTSIHEYMWNSKSWPDGLPHQKNGAMDSRQTPASSNAREIRVLSSLSFTLMLCRDAAWRVSHGRDGASPVSTDRAILLHWKILVKLTEAKAFSENGDVVSDQRLESTTGAWTGTKDGVPVQFPVSWRDICYGADVHWLGGGGLGSAGPPPPPPQ